MVLLYEACNGVEAHMILDLLAQRHLTGRIDGEYLQGGVGELQAIGVVRVMVNLDDYEAAREVIEEWDARQSADDSTSLHTTNLSYITTGLMGFVLGALTMLAYFSGVTD